MHAARLLITLSVATLAIACASPETMQAAPATAGMAPMTMAAPGPMAAMAPRMNALHAMHQKMAKAAPAQRQALMADHMKAMQDGMVMLKEMHAMHATQGGDGQAGMGRMEAGGNTAAMAGMGGGKGNPADPTGRHQQMTDQLAMMQMVLDMMADRMPPAAAGQ